MTTITIAPTSDDVDALARLVVQEAGNIKADYETEFAGLPGGSERAMELAYGSVIDNVLNRVASDSSEYGTTIQDVIDKNSVNGDGDTVYQYSSVAPWGSWSAMPTASSAVLSFVESYLTDRAEGDNSLIGAATHYYNPNLSLPDWWSSLEQSENVQAGDSTNQHLFGILPLTDALPNEYTISYGGYSTTFNPFPAPIPQEKPVPVIDTPMTASVDPAQPVPAAVSSAFGPFVSSSAAEDPLVIDVSSGHTGITLTTFDASSTTTFFDLTGDGFARQTAWTSGNTGFLVDDLNGNGKIDSVAEMFGSNGADGFAQLAALDTNHDLKIDASDAAWSSLQVWIDSNGDGITEAGELHSLSSLGITSIDLAGVTPSTSLIDGNSISHTSTVTFSDGSTSAIDDVWFQGSPDNTVYTGSYTVDAETMLMPDLRGYGSIPDLTIAMSQDATLKGMVQDFVSEFQTSGFASSTLDSDFASILYQWAGVSGVDPSSRGPDIDARQVGFLEHLIGETFTWNFDALYTTINAASAESIQQSWNSVATQFMDDVILQAGGQSLFTNAVTYNPWTGEASGDTSLSHTAVEALATAAPTDPTANLAYWTEVGHFIETIKGFDNVTTTEDGWLNDAISSTNASLNWDDVVAQIGGTVTPNSISDSTNSNTVTGTDSADSITIGGTNETVHAGGGNDTINGTYGHGGTFYGEAGDDVIYGGDSGVTMYGGDGNDTLHGGSGDDVLSGGAGGNMLYGGAGNDTYIYTAGADDYIAEQGSGGTDKIVMPSGITLSDLTFTRIATDSSDYNDLLITVSGGGTIQINDQFSSSSFQVESIQFADSTTYDLTSLTGLPYVGTNGDDSITIPSGAGGVTIQALGGNDYINVLDGTNTIDGGAGNDTIYGGSGNDTYIASPGYDVINERGGTDTIQIPVGYSLSDLTFSHVVGSTNDLLITIAGLGEIRVANQFLGGSYAVEDLHFMADGSTVSLTDQVVQLVGTSGNDWLYGATAGVGGNEIDSRGGSDVMDGGIGNNTFVIPVGFGNDTVEESYTTGTNSIHFQGVDPSHIVMWTDSSGNLHIEDTTNSSYNITVDAATTGSGIAESKIGSYLSSIIFDDSSHTTWDMTHGLTLNANVSTQYGTAYDDTISGGSSTTQEYGNGGNDTLYAPAGTNVGLYGGTGDDTYVFSSGFHNATVNESLSSGNDTIHFTGIDPSDIRLYTDSSGNIHLQDITDPTYAITVYGGVTGSGTNETNIGAYVEQITFDDTAHTVWDLTGGLTITGDNSGDNLYGTAHNDVITGGSGWDSIYGNGGDDTISGGAGHNWIDGGTGNNTVDYSNGTEGVVVSLASGSASDNGYGSYDTLTNIQNVTGSAYADTITGDSNDNILYGNGGNDTLTGGDGADTFIFKALTAFTGQATITDFNTSQNDKIDISDLLHAYNPVTDAISDFVQLTTSGSNTLLKVDIDGTGTDHSPTTIATLQGVTGLDLNTLISDHHLIVTS